eukprot:3938709-Rhodomonas_salina.1
MARDTGDREACMTSCDADMSMTDWFHLLLFEAEAKGIAEVHEKSAGDIANPLKWSGWQVNPDRVGDWKSLIQEYMQSHCRQ